MLKILGYILMIPIALIAFSFVVLGYVASFLVDFLSALMGFAFSLLCFPLGFIFGFSRGLLHDKKRW